VQPTEVAQFRINVCRINELIEVLLETKFRQQLPKNISVCEILFKIFDSTAQCDLKMIRN
jgi:hypothetical protein